MNNKNFIYLDDEEYSESSLDQKIKKLQEKTFGKEKNENIEDYTYYNEYNENTNTNKKFNNISNSGSNNSVFNSNINNIKSNNFINSIGSGDSLNMKNIIRNEKWKKNMK